MRVEPRGDERRAGLDVQLVRRSLDVRRFREHLRRFERYRRRPDGKGRRVDALKPAAIVANDAIAAAAVVARGNRRA